MVYKGNLYSKIKKWNLVLINNVTHQRETSSERPIRPPLKFSIYMQFSNFYLILLVTKNLYQIVIVTHSGQPETLADNQKLQSCCPRKNVYFTGGLMTLNKETRNWESIVKEQMDVGNL